MRTAMFSTLVFFLKLILLSGKIYLFILENTNCTNNTNPCGASPCLSHTNCTNTLRIIKNVLLTCASFGLRYKMPRTVIRVIRMRLAKKISRTVIRVIREIRVLLNIEILILFRLNIYKGACMSTMIHQTMSYLYLPAI